MNAQGTPSELERKGQKILELYEAGEIDFTDHEFRFAHLDELDVTDLVQEGSISAEDIKLCFPDISNRRLQNFIENPDDISDEERETCVQYYLANSEAPSSSALFVFIPVEDAEDKQAIAVVISYGDIPGGEYELYGTFNNQSEAEDSLQGTLWYG